MQNEQWMSAVRERTDEKLRQYLDAKLAEAKGISPDSMELVSGITSLTMRGGKRFRPIVVTAAFEAVCSGDVVRTVDAGASLELLQSYLLIHDDWMDQDDERRGGPAVHTIYRGTYSDHIAASLAILAGDLASTFAWELMLEAPFPEARKNEGIQRFIQIHKEVFFGQHLDVTANADVQKMHHLKTGSYTVNGPLLIGAILGDASEAQIAALLEYGTPIGEAFQLRDDLLGTFGGDTGKPGDDLINGKRNALVSAVEKALPKEELGALTAIFGDQNASADAVAKATDLLVSSGARKSVEDRLASLLTAAKDAANKAPFSELGRSRLCYVADRLAVRSY